MLNKSAIKIKEEEEEEENWTIESEEKKNFHRLCRDCDAYLEMISISLEFLLSTRLRLGVRETYEFTFLLQACV